WSVLSWNVRGLGDPDKCTTVRDALCSSSPSFACIQESKLQELGSSKARGFLPRSLPDFLSLSASGTRGGIVTAWDSSHFTLSSSLCRAFSLTTTFSSSASDATLTISNVYAPSDHRLSSVFLDELIDVSGCVDGPWIIIGDFNL
ncbi:hypothetical protein BS78_09G053400, partial [Paspalum vaginatum]